MHIYNEHSKYLTTGRTMDNVKHDAKKQFKF
jgi:hypothetical protein